MLISLERAQVELDIAKAQFEWADGQYIDAVIHRIQQAEIRVGLAVAEQKGFDCTHTRADVAQHAQAHAGRVGA